MPSSSQANLYLHYLQLAEAVRGQAMLPPLDPLEERLLRIVAHAWHDKERLSVRDMMGRNDVAAPATIHTRLKSMREKGWIELLDTDDARRKQIGLSQAALLHFDKLGVCLLKAAGAV